MAHNHNRQNLFASKIAFMIAFSLAVIKLFIGFVSGSLAVLASGVDSFFDMIVSIVNYFTIKAAAHPPDQEHPYGHGKFEAFAEFFQSLLIGGSGIFLIIKSIKRIINPENFSQEIFVFGVMIVSFLVTFFLVLFLKKSAQKTGSIVLKADMEHYKVDLLSNGAIIGGLILSYLFDWYFMDGVLSLIVSVFIIKSSLELFWESFKILTDREIEKKNKNKIIKILNNCKDINNWHELRTRRSGSHIHMDVHLEFPEDTTLLEAHDKSLILEKEILKNFPNMILLTHFDTYNDQAEENE